ncbi:Immediate early response 3-interacting protein 1 [Tupaia chinensis]|uniref:Immediate early response 3-interacting protein 1 n=1 Tax=Tupaia chinensis TaxID=246437 RepID=L9KKL0_TUPCH|nr:Immediate early response 3-interacting protein 1 [Tupaia chinensis]
MNLQHKQRRVNSQWELSMRTNFNLLDISLESAGIKILRADPMSCWRYMRKNCWGGIGQCLGAAQEAMAFTLYLLLQEALLCVKAITVLHEERFLKKLAEEQTRKLVDLEKSQELNLS